MNRCKIPHGDVLSLVAVDNLHVPRAGGGPDEADAVLVVDADAVLALAITGQGFETVYRRHSEITDLVGRVEHEEFLERSLAEFGAVLRDSASAEQFLCVLVGERKNHELCVPRSVTRTNKNSAAEDVAPSQLRFRRQKSAPVQSRLMLDVSMSVDP